MTARGTKFANMVDKENIAPPFDAENLITPVFVPPAKMKHQETNHYLDLHTPNHSKHTDDSTPDKDTPNHSMELTSEEINERCKLLKLKIQRMRASAATTQSNDTGNISSNITDDLSKKDEKQNSPDSHDQPPTTTSVRLPLQTLSQAPTTPSVMSAGSTPFGPPKQSSHLPASVKPEIPTSIPSASSIRGVRRFGNCFRICHSLLIISDIKADNLPSRQFVSDLKI